VRELVVDYAFVLATLALMAAVILIATTMR
jgi:hypothetical protein